MAVIKNKKTGMWEVRTYYKDLTGARKQKTKRGFAKKSEALEWERNFKLKEDQLRNIMFNGKSCLPPQMTTCEEHKIQFRIPKRQIADLSEKEV